MYRRCIIAKNKSVSFSQNYLEIVSPSLSKLFTKCNLTNGFKSFTRLKLKKKLQNYSRINWNLFNKFSRMLTYNNK